MPPLTGGTGPSTCSDRTSWRLLDCLVLSSSHQKAPVRSQDLCWHLGGTRLYCVGRVLGGPASSHDRPFFRPDISPVGADRASVMRCRRSLLLAGGCCCCHRCC